jgi:hypothetical protein
MQNGRRFTGYGSGRNSETQCNSEYSASVHCSVPTSVNCSVVDMRLADSSGGRDGHKCVRRILKEGSNNGATAPADERQLAIGGLPLSEDILSLREVAGWMIGS